MISRKKKDDAKKPSRKAIKNKKNVYDDRLAELIGSGELRNKGIDGLFKIIQKEFNSQVHGLTKNVLKDFFIILGPLN